MYLTVEKLISVVYRKRGLNGKFLQQCEYSIIILPVTKTITVRQPHICYLYIIV